MSDTTPAQPSSRYGTWIPGILLIPTFFALERAYANFQAGRTGEAIGSLTGGLVLIALIVIFLLDLNIRQLWPVFLIIGGISLLLSRGRWSPN